MDARTLAHFESTIPDDDDHPYRTGPWRPTSTEWSVTDCVVEGDLPDDLNGVYLRNTENPLHPSIGRYHPFDGDGMIHAVEFGNGSANYRNRFTRTDGFEAELAAGGPLWAGIAEPPSRSVREDGWGARTRMKDASSTDVVVHNGLALSSHYQCGDLYAMDPITLEQRGKVDFDGWFPPEGISAHPKVDLRTGELLFFNYSKRAPYLNYGVADADGRLAHYTPIDLPGPRLPHDMAFTENYAILNDCPLFWDEDALKHDVHAVRFHDDLPTRIGVVPRRGTNADIMWFEGSPTFVLHWINAFEDGHEVVLDGFYETNPAPDMPTGLTTEQRMFRFIDNTALNPVPHRWRMNMKTGMLKEEFLSDRESEFGMINPARAARDYRYVYSALNKPGWFLFNGLRRTDVKTGDIHDHFFGDDVFISESPMVPRPGATVEDDGYLVTFVTDMVEDRSYCAVLDASDIAAGPLAKVILPERISSGTHSYFMATDGVLS